MLPLLLPIQLPVVFFFILYPPFLLHFLFLAPIPYEKIFCIFYARTSLTDIFRRFFIFYLLFLFCSLLIYEHILPSNYLVVYTNCFTIFSICFLFNMHMLICHFLLSLFILTVFHFIMKYYSFLFLIFIYIFFLFFAKKPLQTFYIAVCSGFYYTNIFIIFRYSLRSPFRSVSSLLLRALWYAYLCIPHNTSEEGYAPVR